MSENRHTADELRTMQNYPLELKLALTENRIRGWYMEFGGDVFVSRSGGKDSDVLGDIVKKLYPDVPQVFINTGLEWDSIRKHGLEVADEVLYPEMNFIEVLKTYGYPILSKEISQKVDQARRNPFGVCSKRFADCEHNRKYPQYSMEKYSWLLDAPFRISNMCCDIMKKKPSKKYEKESGRKPIVGTMASESLLRKTRWIRYGCNAFEGKRPISAPLSFWTENDILEYIRKNNVKIADIYGDVVFDNDGWQYYDSFLGENLTTTGVKRTGCTFCLFGIRQDSDRLLKLKELEPKKYDFVMNGGEFDDSGLWIPNKNGLGYKFVIDWLNEHGNLNILY